MAKTKEKFIIIDGNALIHRSFHALPPTMQTKDGRPTNAVYGFASVFLKALKEFRPQYAVLTLDRKEKTFRHEEYKEYKATRIKAPDELYVQIPFVKAVVEAFGVPIFEKAGFEADDLIGTLTKKIDGGIEKIIVTGDMDTLQLINDNTKVYTMSRGLSDSVLYGEKEVIARYGLKPEQMIDYKALRGDPSDNIPGVRGIGEKTAVELLKEFKTLENVYKYAEKEASSFENKKIKPRILNLLLEHKKEAYLSQKLALIKCDVPFSFKLNDAKLENFDLEAIANIFSELEFRSLLSRVKDLTDKNTNLRKTSDEYEDKYARNKNLFQYKLIDEEKNFQDFIIKLKKQKEFSFDTETSSFDPITSTLLGISFSWKEGEAHYIKIKNPCLAGRQKKSKIKKDLFNYKDDDKFKANPWLEALKPIFEDEKVKKIAHNGKFDIRVLKNNGIEVRGFEFDTMIASYLLNPGTRQHNLDALTFSELGFEKISKDDLLGKGRDRIGFSEVETEKLSLYSCEDADFTNRLKLKLEKELKKQNLVKLFNEIEIPLVKVLSNMEENGVLLDNRCLKEFSREVSKKISKLQKEIWKIAKGEFNISSTQQLKEVLFEKLDISTLGIAKTKTGFSTAADELVKLKNEHEIIPLIQEYRELTKLFNTYIESLPKLINPETKRIHASFNQTVTATGRLSSTEPNLQNIPIKTELGRKIRKAFISEKGKKFLALDYSQIELRLAAHMSGDKKMIKAFQDDLDIHTATAAEINGVDLSEVTKQMRREAKAINFGILYGQGPYGLSQTADIPYNRARDFIDNYFQIYKDIKKYTDSVVESACEKGYAETLFGRRRPLPEINSSVPMVRKGAERMAINTPLQGTSADMIKIAMIRVQEMIDKEYAENDLKILIQVHDELLFEVKNDLILEVAEKIKNIMREVIKLKVPVEVDVSLGKNWGEMEALK